MNICTAITEIRRILKCSLAIDEWCFIIFYIDDLCILNDLRCTPVHKTPFAFYSIGSSTIMNDLIKITHKEGSTEWSGDTTDAFRIRCSIRANTLIAAIDGCIPR